MAKERKIKDAKVSEELEKEKNEEIEEIEELEADTNEVAVEEEKEDKKETDKKEKKNKKEGYIKKVHREMKKVVWPKASEVVKYTFAVLVFCIFLAVFFKAIELLAAFLKELFV